MANLSDHKPSTLVKALLVGDSGTGKTGSLASLVKAGYKLRILDFDNLLGSLIAAVQRDCPDKLNNISFRTLRDKVQLTAAGAIVQGAPKAFLDAVAMIQHWKDGAEDLGKPESWGSDTILVIDSNTRLGDAAMNWADFYMVKAGAGGKDYRAVVGAAQSALESLYGVLTAADFATNVLIIAHLQYEDRPDGAKRGYPKAPGNKLSPNIPTYFSTVLLYESSGSGKDVKRTIKTQPTPMIDLKSPAFGIDAALPIETGLATFFAKVRGNAK